MVTTMLDKAFETIPDGTGLILHSDQGWQYQHKHYQRMLREKGIRQSMSRKGNCLDNAVMENFFGLKRFVLWHPRLYADVSVYDTPYPHFPIPRLVFGFSLNQEGKASHCRIGVVADEIPTPETPMYYYPFSNVSRESGSLCVGANTLPIYKKPHKAHNLPAFLLSIPNNMHYYSSSNNKLGLEYRELMEHLKDKDPEYYYSDILIPKKETLGEFIQRA